MVGGSWRDPIGRAPHRDRHQHRRQADHARTHRTHRPGVAHVHEAAHHRDQQDQHHAGDPRGGQHAVDARAVVVGDSQRRAPGRHAQHQDRHREVEHQQPAHEVATPDARRRQEQHRRAQRQDRPRGQEPGPIAAEPRARLVHQQAQERIDAHVQDAHQRPGSADHRQRHAEVAGKMRRQIDQERDAQRRRRELREREDDRSAQRKAAQRAGGGSAFHASAPCRFLAIIRRS